MYGYDISFVRNSTCMNTEYAYHTADVQCFPSSFILSVPYNLTRLNTESGGKAFSYCLFCFQNSRSLGWESHKKYLTGLQVSRIDLYFLHEKLRINGKQMLLSIAEAVSVS